VAWVARVGTGGNGRESVGRRERVGRRSVLHVEEIKGFITTSVHEVVYMKLFITSQLVASAGTQ